MPITITNVSKNLRPTGRHRYRVQVNKQEIVEFSHNREDGLGVCLIKAGKAVEKKRAEDLRRMVEAFVRPSEVLVGPRKET